MWSSLDTNRKIGSCFTNDPPGQTFFNNEIGFPPALKKTGFEMVDVGLFEPGSNDFSRQIAAFRDAGCNIMTGLFDPPASLSQAAGSGMRAFSHLQIAAVRKARMASPKGGRIMYSASTILLW